jgi:hypothetical protein
MRSFFILTALVISQVLTLPLNTTSAASWDIEFVDARRNFSNFYSRAIAVDSDGYPHIAYGEDRLYYAHHNGISWQYETVNSSPRVGQYASIAIDQGDNIHISYYDESNGDLMYATDASGNWVTETVDSLFDVGKYSSIAVDSLGDVHISYYDTSRWDLKYAKKTSGTWSTQIIDNSGGSSGRTGTFSSLTVDLSDNVHISYYDASNFNLKYATDSTGSWVHVTADSSADDVGWYTSIATDSSGNVHVSHYDWDNGDLKYATCSTNCTQAGNWNTETVQSTGDVGNYSSITAGSGNVHISHYDETKGDIKYVTGTSGSWSSGTVDSTGDVGGYTSIAIDSSGVLHVSYFDWDDTDSDLPGDLKYVTGTSGSWGGPQTLDSEGDVGGFTSVAADASGNTYISYYDWREGILLCAENSSGSWIYEIVDDAGDVGGHSALGIDTSGNVHISYYDWDNGNLKYATNASGVWVVETVDSGGGGGDVGVFSDIALDSSGNVHISYYDWKNGYLKHAVKSSGAWQTEAVDSNGDVGWYTSIAIDSSDTIHISYYDFTNGNLKYVTGTYGSWGVTDTVDSTGDVGEHTSIAIDSADDIHISYYDVTNGDLRYATNKTGLWVFETVDNAGDVGEYSSIDIDLSDKVHVSYYHAINQDSGDFKYATNTAGLWVAETVDSGSDIGLFTSLTVDSFNRIHISYYDNTNFDLKYTTTQLTVTSETNCFDDTDNDGDTLTDCADPDCDGATDGSCTTGQPGICSAGTRTCQGGAEICEQDNQPEAEVCDNLDNNCDGSTDENLTRPTSCGAGECSGNMGEETCTAGAWGGDTCDPLAGATAEVCDNLDNDCDESIDENLMRPTTCGMGECSGNTGEETCTAGTWGGDTCDPFAGAGAETCDGSLDEDCDGTVDEGCDCSDGETRSCGSDVGECVSGTQSCVGGTWDGTCAGEIGPTTEVCDNLDNDCDGSTDEDLTRTSNCGLGECSGNTGTETCTAGAWGNDTCDPLEGAAAEICDNLDNDCDGPVDEGLQYLLTTNVEPLSAGVIAPDCETGCWYECFDEVELTAIAGEEYIFSHWNENISASQRFYTVIMDAEKTAYAHFDNCTISFSDVSSNYWAKSYISRIACNGITSGYGDGTYKPANNVTRAEMAVYIIRAMEGDPASGYCGTTDPFTDVASGHWACGHIKRLSELGISSGYPDGTYKPTNKVNRAEMAVYVSRAFLGME